MLEQDFKQAFGALAAGVSVVTFRVDGHVHGFTATSVTSVSMEPPLALFCVGRGNLSHRYLDRDTRIGISILAADQHGLSNRFAGKADLGGYGDIEMLEDEWGVPLLPGAVATMAGAVADRIPAGDHTIYVCNLHGAQTAAQRSPLLYCSRGYHTLGPLG